MDFTGKVVIVTGSGVGIGRAAAVMYAKAGAKVVVNSLTPKNGEETLRLVKECGEGIYVQADVSNPDDAKRIVDSAVSTYGRLDILVNNAGVVLPGRVEEISPEDWDKTLAVNLTSIYYMCRNAVPVMKAQGGGVIVNNASVVAVKGVKDRAAYAASKGGVTAMSKSMAADYIKENIRVNCVCPGTTDTPSLHDRWAAFPDPVQAQKDFIARQPIGRLGEDSELAHAILFASCDECAFMNGEILSVDGGMTI